MIKHFIDIDDFKKINLREILIFARKIKNNPTKYSSLLSSKSIGMLFEKQSTRTRLSFNIGTQKIGGNVIELDQKAIGFGTRESERDILKTLSQYIDCLMIRNNDHSKIRELASFNELSIINGLSDFSHPCQVLSDIFTIEELLGDIEKRNICWVGDFNNVLISLLQAAKIFNFKLNVAIPNFIIKSNQKKIDNMNLNYVNFFTHIHKAVKNVDCIMTDVWFSMGDKKNNYKKKALENFQVNKKVLDSAKKNTIFMHCLPAHRNEEVTNDVIDSKHSVVWQQAQNRMYVQQSILNYLIVN